MSYCAICGRQHDPDVGCLDGTGQALRDIGLRQRAEGVARAGGRAGRAVAWFALASVVVLLAVFAWWLVTSGGR